MNFQMMKAWLLGRGYTEVSKNLFEKDENRYELRAQSFARRSKLSANRWSGATTSRYTDRYITFEGKLGYRTR